MKKALLPLLIASALPAAAFADVIVYGKANVSWQNTDLQNGGTYTELVNNESRIGVKGGESINDDLRAIYQFEYQTKVDDGSISNTCTATSTTATPAATTKTTCSVGGQTFSQRNIYVGLQTAGGTVMAGMFDTPLKTSQEKIDLFNDLIGDMRSVLHGETRARNVVQYTSPAFSNVTANIAYVNSEVDKEDTGDGYSASVVYNTKSIYLALANDQNVTNAMNKSVFIEDTDIIRAVSRFVVGPVVLGALYQTYDNGVIDEDGYLASAQWNLTPAWALKAQYGQSEMITLDAETASIGVDYKISKATKIYGYYTQIEDGVVDITKQRDDNYAGVGIELNF